MQSMSQYTDTLMNAVNLIAQHHTSAADWLINNYYHRQKRSGAEYTILLQLTLRHRAFQTATEETQQELARILFLLDKKHAHTTHPVYIEFRKEVHDGEERVIFTLKERESTPAH